MKGLTSQKPIFRTDFLKAKLPLANLQGSDLRGSFITYCPTNPDLSTDLKGATYNIKKDFQKVIRS